MRPTQREQRTVLRAWLAAIVLIAAAAPIAFPAVAFAQKADSDSNDKDKPAGPTDEELAELKRMAMEMVKKTQKGDASTQPTDIEKEVLSEIEKLEKPTTQPTSRPTSQPTTQPAVQTQRPRRQRRLTPPDPDELPKPVARGSRISKPKDDQDKDTDTGEVAAVGLDEDPELKIPQLPENKLAWDMPDDFRVYVLDWDDEELEDIVDDFGRQTGLTILDTELLPKGKKVTYHGQKMMNYWEALGAVNNLLDSEGLRLLPQQVHLIVVNESEVRQNLDAKNILPTLDSFERANPNDEEVVLLFFYPPEGATPSDVQSMLPFLPDWARLEAFQDSGVMQITAKAGDIRKLLRLVQTAVQAGGDDPRLLKIIQLDNVPASTVLGQIQEMLDLGGGSTSGAAPSRSSRSRRSRSTPSPGVLPESKLDQVDIAADDVVNVLIVRAMPKKLAEIEKFVADIESTYKDDESSEPVPIRLRYAAASEVAQTIAALMASEQKGSPRPSAGRRTSRGRNVRRGGAAATPAAGPGESTIVPDDRTNTLFVVADDDEIVRIRAMVRMLDVPAEDENVERVPLEHITAAEAEVMLGATMGASSAGGSTRRTRNQAAAASDSVRIAQDPNGKALFLSGTQERIDYAKKLVKLVDLPQDDDEERHMVQLVNQTPSTMANILGQVESEGGAAPRRPTRRTRSRTPQPTATGGADGPRFIANDESSTLIVICATDEWPDIEETIRELDERAGFEDTTRRFTFVNANAADVANVIQQIFAAKQQGRGNAAAAVKQPTFAVDESGNQLFVRASDADLKEIADVIEQIEAASADQQFDEKIFTLTYAQPEDVISVLSMMYGVRTSAPTQRGRRGSTGASQAVTVDARFAANGQSIVVFAKPNKLEEIGEMIAALDTKDVQSTEIRRYTLANVDVTQVARQLGELFKAERGSAGVPGPTFVPDVMGKGVLVSAPKDIFPRIEGVINGFEADRQPMLFKVFDRLEYANADAMVPVIKPMLDLRLQELLGESAPRGKSGGGARVEVSADPRANRLIVAAPAEVMVYAEQLVHTLDEPQDGDLETPVLRTIYLKNANATALREQLMGMMQGSADAAAQRAAGVDRASRRVVANVGKLKGSVAMVPASGDKAFVLRGLAEDVDHIEALIKTLDEAAISSKMVFKQYPCFAPDEMANTILTLLDPKYVPRVDDFGFPIGPFKGKDISIVADTYNAQMLVSAPPSVIPEIEEVMDRLATMELTPETSSSSPPPKFVQIEKADPWNIVDTLQPMLEAAFPDEKTRPELTKVPMTNLLSVSCTEDQFPYMQELIKKLDKSGRAVTRQSAFAKVRGPLPPGELVKLLQERTPNVKLKVGESVNLDFEKYMEEIPAAVDAVPTEIEPDAPKFAMPAAMLAVRAALIGQTPTTQPAPSPRSARDDDSTARIEAIAEALGDEDDAEAAELSEVQITYDPRTNAFRLVGSPDAVALVQESLDEILDELKDVPLKAEIRVFRLKYISPTQAASVLERMLDAMMQSRNTQRLQQARAQQMQAQRLQQQRAQQLQAQQQRMRQAQQQQKGGGEEETKEEDRERERRDEEKDEKSSSGSDEPEINEIRVYPYERLQAIVIRAVPTDWPMILELLAKVDQKGAPVEFRTFKLVKSNAGEALDQLKTLLGINQAQSTRNRASQQRAGQQNRGAQSGGGDEDELMTLPPLPDMDIGDSGESKAIDWSRQVTMTADAANNAILVAAPKTAMEYIEMLITKIEDEKETPVSDVDVYELANADAASLASQIVKAFGGDDSTGGTPMRVAADDAANTIMVWAPPHVRTRIAEYIREIDKKAESPPVRQIKLTQADAEVIAPKLQEAFGTTKRGERLVKITGDKASGQLFIKAPDDIYEQITAMVPTLDLPAAPFTPRIYPLDHAYAAEAITQFKEMTTQLLAMQKQVGGTMADMEVFAATADPRTNALIVLGGPNTHALVQAVLASIDVEPKDPTNRVTQIWVLQKARASEAQSAVDKLFQEKGREKTGVEAPVAQANESNNTLLVRGTKKQLAEIDGLIKKLDGVGQEIIERDTRVFALQFGDPNQTAAAINAAFQRSGNVPDHDKVQATGELGSRSVIVTARPEAMTKIEELIGQLDKETAATKTTRLIKLEKARAADTVTTLRELYEQSRGRTGRGQVPITIVANDATNALIVSAQQSDLDDVAQMVSLLDVEPLGDAGLIQKAYVVENANPYSVAEAIRNLFPPARGRPQDEVRAAADWGSYSLIVSASAENHKKIEELITTMDAKGEGDLRPRVIEVLNADAGQIMQALHQTYRDKMQQKGGSVPQFAISNPNGTNRILVRAKDEDFNEIKALVHELDAPPTEDANKPKIIHLNSANPTTLASILTKLFTDTARKQQGRSQDSVPVILADDQSSSLIVQARPADYDTILDTVQQFDTDEMAVTSTFEIIPIADGIDVADMAQKLQDLINQSEQDRSRQEPGYKPRLVRIEADDRANALIIGGDRSQFAQVEQMAKRLEGMKPTGNEVIRVINVKNLDPDDAKRVLEQMIEGQNSGNRNRSGDRGRRRR